MGRWYNNGTLGPVLREDSGPARLQAKRLWGQVAIKTWLVWTILQTRAELFEVQRLWRGEC